MSDSLDKQELELEILESSFDLEISEVKVLEERLKEVKAMEKELNTKLEGDLMKNRNISENEYKMISNECTNKINFVLKRIEEIKHDNFGNSSKTAKMIDIVLHQLGEDLKKLQNYI